jgi:hypothetical protein
MRRFVFSERKPKFICLFLFSTILSIPSKKPPQINKIYEEFRLHNPDGAAMLFRDGWGVYSIHGILVPDDIIEEPEKITWQRVVAESNAEVRRLMMDKMGKERLLRESEAKEVDRDRFGTLYRIEVKDDEPIQLLHVLNSTPNPDGSQKPYVLRVSPNVKTAHEAAASTFRLKAIEYWPGMES